tara:strand:+ start:6875 stop:7621 length:747 start_codon:yes stop_codon:yes gene_type:complete
MIKLPTEKREALRVNPRNLLLFAPSKIGKSTLACKLEGNLILDFEKGTEFLDAMSIHIDSITKLEEVCNAIKAAEKPYKYITVDTITALEEKCEWTATLNYMETESGAKFNRVKGKISKSSGDNYLPFEQWKSVLTLPWGSGYYYLRQEVKHWVKEIGSLTDHLIILGHVKDSFIDADGSDVVVKQLDLTGKLKNIIAQDMDAMGYMFRDQKGNLKISFVSGDAEAGSRCPHLINKIIDAEWEQIFIN